VPAQQTRHQLALRLASRVREIDPDRRIAAVAEWRTTIDDLTKALKKARRRSTERVRGARRDGREMRPEIPGLSGVIFNGFWDFVFEGATVGAERELTVEDTPSIVAAYRQLEAAMVERLPIERSAGRKRLCIFLAAMRLHAVALGYWQMRGSFGESIGNSIEMLDVTRNERPAIDIAVLALRKLGHENADIARGLRVDSARVRLIERSARSAENT
jgi:hypothetical protein